VLRYGKVFGADRLAVADRPEGWLVCVVDPGFADLAVQHGYPVPGLRPVR
jgi:hypothetical protein